MMRPILERILPASRTGRGSAALVGLVALAAPLAPSGVLQAQFSADLTAGVGGSTVVGALGGWLVYEIRHRVRRSLTRRGAAPPWRCSTPSRRT